jgi:cytochrome P450
VAANDANAKPSGQAGFWVFVIKDAIELHTVRTLALIVNASDDVRKRLLTEIQAADPPTADTIVGLNLLEGCLREQLRLWTPVPILLRVAVKDFRLGNIQIRAGQQILMHTGFYHRDKEEFGVAADRFSPQDSLAPLYVFSQGRQACAGQFLAIFLLKAVLAALLRHATFALPDQRIDVCQVPAAIDQFALRFSWRPYTDVRHGPARSRTVTEPGSLA